MLHKRPPGPYLHCKPIMTYSVSTPQQDAGDITLDRADVTTPGSAGASW